VSEDKERDDRLSSRAEVEEVKHRVLQRLGTAEPAKGSVGAGLLAFFPPALALVGVAIAYELSASLWGAAVGLFLGGATGFLWVRDCLRRRLHPITFALSVVLLTLFAWVYFIAA